MTSMRRILRLAALAAIVFAAGAVHAKDVDLRFDFLESQTIGPRMVGHARIEVRNLTGSLIRDVDVSLAHPGPDTLEKGNVHFGALPPGKARIMTRRLSLSTRADLPLLWRVSFLQDGTRREVVLLGDEIEIRRGR